MKFIDKGKAMRILFGAMPAILVSALATTAGAEKANENSANEKALFVQHAASATLSDGTLTLSDIDNHVIAFSDRPMRATLTIPVEGLIEIWNKGKDSFADDPPNAVLVGEADGKATSVVVELTNPSLSESNLTFDYVLLKGQDPVKLDRSYMVLDETWWGDLEYVADVATGQPEAATILSDSYPD